MALFMVANNLTPDDIVDNRRRAGVSRERGRVLRRAAGPAAGRLSAGTAGARVLKGTPPMTERPGASLPAADFDAAASDLATKLRAARRRPRGRLATCSIPACSRTSPRIRRSIPTRRCCRRRSSSTACDPGDELSVEIEPGKTLIVKLLAVGDPHPDGTPSVFFELNGQPREVAGRRPLAGRRGASPPKADPGDPNQIGAPLPGLVVGVDGRAGRAGARRATSCSRSRR